MKHIFYILILVQFTQLETFGQSITIYDIQGCYFADEVNFSVSNGGNPARNIYTGFATIMGSPMRVIWSSSNNRWELQLDGNNNGTFSDIQYASTYASYPKPPDHTIGNWSVLAGCTPLTWFVGTGTQNVLSLPIELTSFKGKNNGNQNFLTWATASETQNKGFDIERSTDGSRFEKIGFVAGHGTTSQTQRYTFNDDKSPNGIAYYRLKQLDYDGRFEYSKIVAIAQKGDNAVSVFPNPSNGVFTLSGLENIEDEQISIVNSIGQNIAIAVQNDGQMDLSAYPSGVYYLRIASSGQVVKVVLEHGF
jgi:hypothetical protein